MKSSGARAADCDDADGYEFSIVSLDNKQWLFEAAGQEERDDWVAAIEQQILASLQGNETNKKRSNGGPAHDPHAVNMIKTQVPGNDACADCDAPSKRPYDYSLISLLLTNTVCCLNFSVNS